MAAGTAERIESLKKAEEARLHAEARHEAGFDDDSDYAEWLVLEELRSLTKSARKLQAEAVRKAKAAEKGPSPFGGTVTFDVTPNFGSLYSWNAPVTIRGGV